MNLANLIFVGLGGFIGSVARFVTVRLVDAKFPSAFPYGTFSVNLVGSFLLGLIYSLAIRNSATSHNLVLFLGAGVCGGFTTFSAFTLENFNLLQTRPMIALSYMLASVAAGIIAVAIGFLVARTF